VGGGVQRPGGEALLARPDRGSAFRSQAVDDRRRDEVAVAVQRGVALHGGVPDVSLADLSAERLASASVAGVPHAVDALDGEFDVVFDAVGSEQTRAASIERLRPGGHAVWIGLHAAKAQFDGPAFIRGEKRVLATFAYLERDFAAAIDLACALDDTPWVATSALAGGVEAFQALLDGPGNATKTLLLPH
jgi:threonine dehydrogenase-like Zn-dependent dehydrogenase